MYIINKKYEYTNNIIFYHQKTDIKQKILHKNVIK